MNLRKLIFFSCLFFLLVSLSACTQNQKKEGANVEQTGEKKKIINNEQLSGKKGADDGKIALKNWNEADYRLTGVKHRKNVQSLSEQFPGVVFYKGNPRLKRVALSFDDGPDNYYTPRILDILRSKGVHGTFFIVGKEAKLYPDMVKRIVREGNAIGNHSWDHPKLWKINNKQVEQEIVSTQNEIQRISGRRTNLFRPPYGRVTPAEVALIHKLGYDIIDWSVDTLDWKGTPAPSILQAVNKEISPGAIILEHCLAGHPGELNGTLQALPQIIDQLRGQGYQFVTVPELIGLQS